MTESCLRPLLPRWRRGLLAALAGLALSQAAVQPALAAQPMSRGGDYIAAVVNSEVVTESELEQRIARIKENARRQGGQLPPDPELRKQVLDSLVEERVLVTYARDSGVHVDDGDVDRAVQSVATQNQLTTDQLRERLKQEGMDYKRFRDNLRDQIMVERVREQEVQGRIEVSDKEVDDFLDKQRGAAAAQVEYDIAQILVTVPEHATPEVVAQREARAREAEQRVRNGEPFGQVAREMSEDGNHDKGGDIGLKPANRLPDVFVNMVRDLKPGQVAPTLLRSDAGFHLLKLVDKKAGQDVDITQTHVRHILLRTSPQLSQDTAIQRLAEMKQQIDHGARFEDLARKYSEDGSAPQGGDLGWVSPGSLVPEFETAMDKLPNGGISDPVVSRFGVHLIQVLARRDVAVDAKTLRAQARNTLREQKFDEAYNEWMRDLRAKAYIELRDQPPQ